MDERKQLVALKALSLLALKEFDELQKLNKASHEKYIKEHDKVARLESQFKQLKKVSLMAVNEFEAVQQKYVETTQAKQEIESQLRALEDENKQLRKAKGFAKNTTILPAHQDGGEGAASKGEVEGLRAINAGLKEETKRKIEEVNRLREELEQERKAHEVTRKKFKIGNEQIKQLNRVSVLALDEFHELRKRYEIETDCRRKAEEYASEMLQEKKAMDRKSHLINLQVESDDRLRKAVEELEAMSRDLERLRNAKDQRIRELEEELESSRDIESYKNLEEKLAITLDQLELSQKQVTDMIMREEEAYKQIEDLKYKLRQAELGIASAPPPPPPPPPPPLPASSFKKIIIRIGGKKKRGKDPLGKDDGIADAHADAMREMMDRIKRGVCLKPALTPVNKDKEEPSAMNELAALLGNFKRGRAGMVDPDEKEKDAPAPEFQRVQLKKTSITRQDERPKELESKESELMKKLEKKKQEAEQAPSEDRGSPDGRPRSITCDDEGKSTKQPWSPRKGRSTSSFE